MALKIESVGRETKVLEHSYAWKDIVLYALGVGATLDEIELLYEKNGPKVLPTYAVIPTFAALDELFEHVGGDFEGVVHGAQKIVLHREFAPESTLKTVGKVAAVYDLKRMSQAIFTTKTMDGEDLVCETEWQIIFRFDGGFDGPRPPKSERIKPPDAEPDFRIEEKSAATQAALYRLSGDINPLHIDPEIATKVGFDRPILHGLCTFGYAGRAVIRGACGGDVSKLRELRGQFRKPVWPGDTMVTQGWNTEDKVVVRLSTLERPDDFAFSNACAIVA